MEKTGEDIGEVGKVDLQNCDYKELHDKFLELERKCKIYESALNTLPNPIFIKNNEGKFMYFNQAYESYFNIKREDYINKSVLDLEFLSLKERICYQKQDIRLIESGDTYHCEQKFVLPDGSGTDVLYWSKGTEFQVGNHSEKGLVGEIVDITLQKSLQRELECHAEQLKATYEKIEQMTNKDTLTGLYNRRILETYLSKIATMSRDKSTPISIILADLDDFKRINDTFGHTVGDKVLVEFASILSCDHRKDDLVIRYGGEEFLIVLFYADLIQAEKIAERIRAKTEEMLVLPDGTTNTVSIGVAEILQNETFCDVVNKADAALYFAKKSGKNRVASNIPSTVVGCRI